MANQLWDILGESFNDFENFFRKFLEADSEISLFQVSLALSGASIRFEPPFADIEATIVNCMEEIASAVVPLFPEIPYRPKSGL